MFAANARQDRICRMMASFPLIGNQLLSFTLKHTRSSGVMGLNIHLSQLSTNYCEARLTLKKNKYGEIDDGDASCGLAQLCEWVAAACYSYTHHQRLSQKLKRWNMEIFKPIESDLVAIAEIHYGCLSGNESKPCTLRVEVLDTACESVASAEFLLTTRPITRE